MNTSTLQIGIIGYRGFGAFCTEAFHKTGRGRVIAYAGRDTNAMEQTARQYGVAKTYPDWRDLINDPDVNLAHIVTPPDLHAEMAIAALNADKHVLIEKPMATSEAEIQAILAAAQAHPECRVGINYVMRYNPLYEKVAQITHAGLLGNLTHVSFQNYASDEGLDNTHWFWNKPQSGGIFVEHGVHFFDIIGSIINAPAKNIFGQTWTRQDGLQKEDRVSASVTYENGIEASYYHAFNRPGALEKQIAHFAFDQGHITLDGWIPTALRLEAILDKTNYQKLGTILELTSDNRDNWGDSERIVRGSGKDYRVQYRAKAHITLGDPTPVYSAAVGAALIDLADAIASPNTHRPRVNLRRRRKQPARRAGCRRIGAKQSYKKRFAPGYTYSHGSVTFRDKRRRRLAQSILQM